MIVVKVELWPLGDERRAREIGRTFIANTGECDDPKRGDYKVKVARRGSFAFSGWDFIKATREGRVEGYPRLSYNVWRLVIRALLDCFPEER